MQHRTTGAARLWLGGVCLGLVVSAAVLLLWAGSSAWALTPAGTIIDNSATLQYDGGTLASNAARLTVAQTAAVSLSPTLASLNGAPGATLYFPVTLTNAGNGSDSFSLSASSARGWTAALLRDDNSDGIHQSSEQTAFTAVNNLAMGAQSRFFAALTIPAGAASGLQDTLSLSARSSFDSTKTAAASYSGQAVSVTGVSLSPTTALVSASTGQKTYIGITVTNLGSNPDTFSLSLSSDLGWTAALLADANQDGIHQDTETTALSSLGPLAAGAQTRAFIQVQVPAGLTADTQANFVLRVVSAADAGQTAQGNYVVVGKAPLPGDIDGDGSITNLDVRAAAQMAVGTGTWSDAQRAKADINGDGVVNVLDVIAIIDQANPQRLQSQVAAGRQISLPTVKASPGSTRALSLGIDEGGQVAGFQATVLFDSSVMSVSEVTPGGLMGGDANWQILYTVGQGEVRVLAYNAAGSGLAAGPGSVVDLQAQVSAAAAVGDFSALAWAEATVSDTTGASLLPLQTVDGLLTVENMGDLAVQVYRDKDSLPIAGAQVEAWLDGNVAASGVTDTAGNCLLSSLAPGLYEIRVSAAGYYGERLSGVVVKAGETASASLGLVVLAKANTSAINGLVINQAGAALYRAQVTFYRNGRKAASVSTNSQGIYQKVGLAPGTYQVTVSLRGYQSATVTVVVNANELAFADFALAPK